MHFATHLMISWTVANIRQLKKRDRGIITLAGIVPDIDAAGMFIGLISGHKDWGLRWHTQYHHVLTHNLLCSLLVFICALLFARQRIFTSLLSLLSFHLHLLGDIIGSRGPDGYQWPINYLYPISDSWQLAWNGQWPLNAWPNIIITAVLLFWTIYLAWKRGYSPIEFISSSADKNFVQVLRRRLGQPKAHGREGVRRESVGGD